MNPLQERVAHGAPVVVASSGARDAAGVAADAKALPDAVGLVEVRLDRFPAPQDVDLAALARSVARPALVTLRPREEGGEFGGSTDARAAILTRAQDSGFAAVDVEADVAARVPRGAALRIVSWHGREPAGADAADQAVARLREFDADVLKVAAPVADARSALAFVRAATDGNGGSRARVTAIAMGAAGRFARPLAGLFGMPLLYGAAHPSRKTADGQVTVADLLDVYGAPAVSAATRIHAVVGKDVSGSLSPRVHGDVFRALGVDAVYVDLSVTSFADALGVARDLPLHGMSVTAPFKQDALAAAEDASDDVRAIGAANTLVRDARGGLRALNTDAPGFLAALDLAIADPGAVRDLCVGHSREALARLGPRVVGGAFPDSALVVGAGGAARAIIHALRGRGVRVFVTGRRFDRVTATVLTLGGGIEAISEGRAYSMTYDLVVKAVPGDGDDIPFDQNERLRDGFAVDVQYRPLDSRFLVNARRWGRVPVPGLLMFAEQASLQAAAFTGAPLERVRPTVAASLAHAPL